MFIKKLLSILHKALYIFVIVCIVITVLFYVYSWITGFELDDKKFNNLLKKNDIEYIYNGVDGFLDLNFGRGTGYGEIKYHGMDMLCKLLIDKNIDVRETVFIDCGSGVGKALVMAILLGYRRVVGVEIVKNRHKMALTVYDRLPSNLRSLISIYNEDILTFSLEELLAENKNKPIVVFTSNLLWPVDITRQLYSKFLKVLPSNSLIVSSIYRVNPEDEIYISSTEDYEVEMSWNRNNKCKVTVVN